MIQKLKNTKIYLLIISYIFISGCDYYKNKHYLLNVYYQDLYAKEIVREVEYIGLEPISTTHLKKENFKTNLIFSPFTFKYDFKYKEDFSLSNSPSLGHSFIRTDFYQDEAMQCYLFSYSMDELIKMREVTNPWWNDPIYIIKKDGISVISESEYKKLELTFKPHPYDASLCKPAPKE